MATPYNYYDSQMCIRSMATVSSEITVSSILFNESLLSKSSVVMMTPSTFLVMTFTYLPTCVHIWAMG